MHVETAPLQTQADAAPRYLAPCVKLEPLMCGWPAWPYLLTPAAHAMNIAFRYLPQLQSFLASPAVHLAASADPAMFGGPFLSLEASDLDQVRALLEETKDRCAPLIRFANELRAFEKQLRERANGSCLDERYAEVPASLSGAVELVYDLNHHPHIKLIHELLAEKGIDNTQLQELCLHATSDSARQFFMSTPMLRNAHRVIVPMSFKDPLLDELASMRLTPASASSVMNRLTAQFASTDALQNFFTFEAPQRNAPVYRGDGVRMRYFGHACVLLQTSDCAVLIDPLTAWQRDGKLATLTFDDLPDFIDYVVITHGHPDHCVAELLLQLRQRVGRVIVPRHNRGSLVDISLVAVLRQLGYTNITAVDPFDRIELLDGFIWSLPFFGEHADLDVAGKQCACVSLKGRSFVFLADTDGVQPAAYRYFAQRLGAIAALFIGMECKGAPLSWLYGPLLTSSVSRRHDESRRLSGSNCQRAWEIVKTFDCAQVFVYAMGQEPWLRHLMGLEYPVDAVQLAESDHFVALCRENGLSAERLYGCRELLFEQERR